MIIENNLQSLLNERNLTQKDLASMVNERETSISEFSKLKRSTINIELLLKIASVLMIENINDLLCFKKLFELENYNQNNWYPLIENEENSTGFSYIVDKNNASFDLIEVSDNGILTHQRYDISNYSKDDIIKEFEKSKLILSEGLLEDELTLMLVQLCRYQGKFISTNRFKSVNEALETMDLFY